MTEGSRHRRDRGSSARDSMGEIKRKDIGREIRFKRQRMSREGERKSATKRYRGRYTRRNKVWKRHRGRQIGRQRWRPRVGKK
jgi:hypothetical protein